MRYICTLFLLSVFATVFANFNPDQWVTLGNEAYLLGQTTKVKECADSLQKWLDTRNLSDEVKADYQVAALKLFGDFHYLLAESSPTALSLAEHDYKKAMEIMKSHPLTSFGMMMPVLLPRELAQVYYRQERYAEAADALIYAIERLENLWQADVYDMPEWLLTRMSHALSVARCGRYKEALEEAERVMAESSIREGMDYARALRMWAKIKMLAEVDKVGALDAYKQYFEEEKDFAFANFAKMSSLEREQYWRMLRPFVADCYRMEDADAGFLYDVALFSKGLLLQLSRLSGDEIATAEALRSLSYKWCDIQVKLHKDEVAIEFIEYESRGRKQMSALVLRHEGSPQFVAMTSPLDIPEDMMKRISSTSCRGKDKLYNDEEVQRMIWSAPLLCAIGDASVVYFAPDGYLHEFAIEYLPQVEGKKMYRLTSTRRLMESSAFDATLPMLLFGAPDFNFEVADSMVFRNDEEAYSYFEGSTFSDLNGAVKEIKMISALRNNKFDRLITGSEATESNLRAQSGNFASVLISTHGDFSSKLLQSPTDVEIPSDKSLMSRNIIVACGANKLLSRGIHKDDSSQDGIISANEIAELNLRSCQLFTISACKSGRGEITPEGVYGLQRGLKNAGVGAMVMSLWDVDDDAAAYFMEDFYAGLQSGLEIHSAFTQARSLLPIHDEATDQSGITHVNLFLSPKFRNAFILIDGLPVCH